MKRSALKAFAVATVSLLAFAAPAMASAQALTQTAQVLPPGGNNCPVLLTQGIVAHVQNGALHSFDVIVGDASYVAVLAVAGDRSVPFNFMTRFNDGGVFLRHHVDMDATRIGNGLPVSLTLLSSRQGAPTCLSIISFSVAADGTIMAPGVTTGTVPPITGQPSSGGSKAPAAGGKAPVQVTVSPTTSTSTVGAPVDGGFAARMQGLCKGNGAMQLWFLLLAIYVVIAALTALAKPPMADKSLWVPLSLILVPLVALLGFWLFGSSCRAAGWIPGASILIAVAALLVMFREQSPIGNTGKVIPLPAAKPSKNTPMITKTAPATVSEAKPNQVKGK